MPFHSGIGIKRNPLVESPYSQPSEIHINFPPPGSEFRITDIDEYRITDSGDFRITD